MSFEIRWSTRASRDLIRIITELDRRDPEWGTAVELAIAEKLDSLADNPFLSSIFRSNEWAQMREVLAANYRIFFQVDEGERAVDLKLIQHVRQQDPEFPE